MANTLKHIKKVRSVDELNNLQILFDFVLGDNMPGKYDPEKTYNSRDFIVHLNEAECKYEILMCNGTTTGEFDQSKWEKISLKDYINRDQGSNKEIIRISEEMPTETHNTLWMEPVAYKDLNTDIIENGNMLIIFNGLEFKGQDDMPDDEGVKLWFDYEFDHNIDEN